MPRDLATSTNPAPPNIVNGANNRLREMASSLEDIYYLVKRVADDALGTAPDKLGDAAKEPREVPTSTILHMNTLDERINAIRDQVNRFYS